MWSCLYKTENSPHIVYAQTSSGDNETKKARANIAKKSEKNNDEDIYIAPKIVPKAKLSDRDKKPIKKANKKANARAKQETANLAKEKFEQEKEKLLSEKWKNIYKVREILNKQIQVERKKSHKLKKYFQSQNILWHLQLRII